MPRYRVINLVIYNAAERHEQLMRRELERLAHPEVKRLFLSLSKGCTATHERDGSFFVPGEESFIPGILHKTVEALSYCSRTFTFEYVVRSNVSTVIDFARLLTILPERSAKIVYASTHIWGTPSTFASGTNIILNAAAVEYILQSRSELRMDIIDDLSIGMLLAGVTTPRQLSPHMVWNGEISNGVVYRNRSDDRMTDVARMARIVNRITASPRGGTSPVWLLAFLAFALLIILRMARRSTMIRSSVQVVS